MINTPVDISILMSVFNGEEFIRDAINSVIRQTFESWELLIVDDCSTDRTLDILKQFDDDRIIIIENDEQKGLTANICKMKQLVRGKYIARLDADDLCRQDRLEKQYNFLEQHPDVDLVCSYADIIGDGKGMIKPPVDHEELKARLLFYNPIVHSSIMMRKTDLFYDESYKKSQDYDLWDRMVHSGCILGTVPEPLVCFRYHKGQVSNTGSESQAYYANKVRSRALGRLGIDLSAEEAEAYYNLLNKNDVKDIEQFRLVFDVFSRIENIYSNQYCGKSLRKAIGSMDLALLKVANAKHFKIPSKWRMHLISRAGIIGIMKDLIKRRIL